MANKAILGLICAVICFFVPDELAAQPEPTTAPAVDPFARLRVRVPKEKLRPLRSVRIRDKRETQKGKIHVTIKSFPKGASVTHGGRALGNTPLTLTAERNSTPLDIVVRRSGYMTLRTRIMRRKSHTYSFKLTPAKL